MIHNIILNIHSKYGCVSASHGSTYHLLVYVKPTKGRWWPEKAVWEGGGMVSWKKYSKKYFKKSILHILYKQLFRKNYEHIYR